MRFQLIFHLILLCSFFFTNLYGKEKLDFEFKNYLENNFQNDLTSPLKNPSAKNYLFYGGAIVSALILTREITIIPLQDWAQDTKPLAHISYYGDLMGQMVPNIAYTIYQWKFNSSNQGIRRAIYMSKSTLFSGGTTFVLKRIINQRRPGGSKDRNSFPSGHTTTAFAFAGVIGNEHPQQKWYGYALASFVGLSRINDNVHYIHDVVMGASIGLAFSESLKIASPISFLPYSDGAILSFNQTF